MNYRNFIHNKSFIFFLAFFSFFSFALNAQVGPGIAPVVNPTGGFHIEGNLQSNNPTAGVGDWVFGSNGAGGNVLTTAGVPVNAATTFRLIDPYNISENNFAGGKKFNDDPNTWTWVTNSALGKCDINNGIFHFTTSNVGGVIHTWLIVSADRRSNTGNAYIDFELLQNTMTDNPNGTFTSAGPDSGRTVGDILLTLSLTGGGGSTEFFVNKWTKISPTDYDYIDRTSMTPAGSVYASTNPGTVPVSYNAFGRSTYSTNLFVEAAIDLTALLGAIDPCTSLGVKTLFIKTKTSQSPTATIVDFISAKQVALTIGVANAGVSQTQCGNQFSVSGTASPSPGDAVSSTVWSVVSGAASIASPANAATSVIVTNSPATLRFTVKTNFGCTVSDTLILTVLSSPVVTVNSAAICSGQSVILTATNNAVNPTYLWSPGGATTPSITVSPSSQTIYTAVVTDGVSKCTGSGQGTVSFNPTPSTPGVDVVNNCDGSSDLTATGFTGTLLWSNGATTTSIHVTVGGTYTVRQTINECVSLPGSGTAAPKAAPATPGVNVVNNCDGSSDLTATGFTGTLLWSNGATTTSIHVTVGGTYTVRQTVNECVGLPGSGTAAPKAAPATPGVNVVNNCDGSSDLTATGFTGTLLWSNGATTTSIHVTVGGTYTVRQTVNECVSLPGSGTAAPKAAPATPGVNVVNNCDGSSDLTATGFTGTLLWSNGATTTSIHVTVGGTYTVRQTVNECVSLPGSGTAAPKTAPQRPSIVYNAPACDAVTFSITVNSVTANATYSVADKDGNTIPGVLPGNTFTPSTNAGFSFTNIPAGSGYKVAVQLNGCASSDTSCGNRSGRAFNSGNTQAITLTGEINPSATVYAYPNPYNDRIRFSLKSVVAGKGSFEIYNLMGQKIKTLFQGNFQKGQVKNIEYLVSPANRTNLVYVFTVGDLRTTGKLINIK